MSDDEEAFPDMKKKKKKAMVVCENKLDTPKFSKKFATMFAERDELYELEGEKDGITNLLISVHSLPDYPCSINSHSYLYSLLLLRRLVGSRPGSSGSGLGLSGKRPPSRSIAEVLSDARRMTLQAQVSNKATLT